LEITNFNPNIRNAGGMTPIQLTNDQGIIQELIRFGAHPMESDVYSTSIQLDIKHPPQPVTKVFIVGNSSVGKSTLTAALQKEASRLGKIFTPAKKVSGVEQRTAGIIPHEFESKKYGQVTLYDFAGHREYYGSHAALLENSIVFSPPIFLLVVDLCDEYDDFKRTLYYWLSFLENQCSFVKPPVIVVGSHVDVLRSEGKSYDEKDGLIQHVQSSDDFTGVDIIGFVAMDCQYSHSDGMDKLRHFLKERCRKFRSLFTEKIRFNAQCFLDYISGKFKECRAITFETILKSIRDEREISTENNPLFCLPANFQTLYDLCYDLNDRGHILLLRDKHKPLKTWVVIDKESLLTEVNGTVFAPEGLRQYSNLASSTGVVPINRLVQKFPNYSPTMLVGFLTHLEYCHEISDEDTLALIGEQVGKCGSETYLFFPALVKAETPSSIWTSKPGLTNHCGWVLKCDKPEQFFTSRFLEVLILRLAFSYALESANDSVGDHDDSDVPVIQRKCTVWKSGIFWGNSDGIEIIVEVFKDNKTVMMAMRCSSKTDKLAFIQLRACIIHKIITAASNFCAKVKTAEYFIDPSNICVYPIKNETLNFINAKHIANLIVKTNTSDSLFVVSEVGESLPITEILLFEPYILVHPQVLIKLFDCSGVASEEIPDWVLNSLAENQSRSENSIIFAKMFDNSVSSPPTSGQLLQILKSWKKSCRGKCTYENLYQQLDKYSIYTKRNLLVSDSSNLHYDEVYTYSVITLGYGNRTSGYK
jgi:signal recognition particle receptor subunit beta